MSSTASQPTTGAKLDVKGCPSLPQVSWGFFLEICTWMVSQDHTLHSCGQDGFPMHFKRTGQALNLTIFGNFFYRQIGLFPAAIKKKGKRKKRKKSRMILWNNTNEKGVLTYMPNINAPVSSRTWIRFSQMTIFAELSCALDKPDSWCQEENCACIPVKL